MAPVVRSSAQIRRNPVSRHESLDCVSQKLKFNINNYDLLVSIYQPNDFNFFLPDFLCQEWMVNGVVNCVDVSAWYKQIIAVHIPFGEVISVDCIKCFLHIFGRGIRIFFFCPFSVISYYTRYCNSESFVKYKMTSMKKCTFYLYGIVAAQDKYKCTFLLDVCKLT